MASGDFIPFVKQSEIDDISADLTSLNKQVNDSDGLVDKLGENSNKLTTIEQQVNDHTLIIGEDDTSGIRARLINAEGKLEKIPLHSPSGVYTSISVIQKNGQIYSPNGDIDGSETPVPFVEGDGAKEWKALGASTIVTDFSSELTFNNDGSNKFLRVKSGSNNVDILRIQNSLGENTSSSDNGYTMRYYGVSDHHISIFSDHGSEDTPLEVLRLTQDGDASARNILPLESETFNLGSIDYHFLNVYSANFLLFNGSTRIMNLEYDANSVWFNTSTDDIGFTFSLNKTELLKITKDETNISNDLKVGGNIDISGRINSVISQQVRNSLVDGSTGEITITGIPKGANFLICKIHWQTSGYSNMICCFDQYNTHTTASTSQFYDGGDNIFACVVLLSDTTESVDGLSKQCTLELIDIGFTETADNADYNDRMNDPDYYIESVYAL